MSAYPELSLGEFCETGSGGTPSRANADFYRGGIPWVKSGELREGVITDTEEKITERAVKESSAKIVPKGAILLAMYGATVGRMAFLGINAATNQAVCNIRPDPKRADSRYVFHCLQSQINHFLGRAAGGAQPNISQGIVKETKIPLPPLEEQRRIAAILDKADALRRKRKRALDMLDGLTESIFFDLFGHTGDDISKWGAPVALSEFAEIGSGITKGRKLTGQATRQVPYLAVANVQDRRLELGGVKSIEATEDEIARYRLRKDDLLLTEGGDPDKLGRGTLWGGELDEAIHQNHIFRVRIKSEAILPLFLNWLVSSPYGKRYFLSVAKQTTGIASINKTQLSAFPAILPPVDLQYRFVGLAEQAAIQAKRLLSSSDNTESLFSSLQSRAFSGQL
ncbi:restriction endonuclease subunit S [Bradyrhizobium sp. LA6.12]|uniref:restriction endonuclease subunit S n=1 Tax=unclassified Bradyrhizobium TaxID=2631580 RepID=UPI00339B804F